MKSDSFKCRGKIKTNGEAYYWFKTFIPPPYGGRPKHIHYLVVATEGHSSLITQLYFKGDKRIKPNNWAKHPWDEKCIVSPYVNDAGEEEIRLDLYLSQGLGC